MADLRMRFTAAGDGLATRDFYGKVIGDPTAGGPVLVRLTSTPPEVNAFLEALRRYAREPG
jgi:hypothetical protein